MRTNKLFYILSSGLLTAIIGTAPSLAQHTLVDPNTGNPARPSGNDVAGLNLCCGEGRKVSISYDAASGYLTLDRTNSTEENLPKFDRLAYTKVTSGNNAPLTLDIFTDKSTIEIFAEDGRKVFTLLTYAAPGQNDVEIFSQRGKTSFDITAWPLRSIRE